MRTPGRRYVGARLLGLWCVLLLGVGTPALALDPLRRISQYNHEAWRSENGLPQNTARALAQTSEGYLWVGTYEGLARFDGARFTVYDRRVVPEMRAHIVSSLVEDVSRVLWVGTSQGVLQYKEGQLRRWAEQGDLA